MYKIYTLSCPFTNNIFYVGKTKRSLEVRLKQHISDFNNVPKKKHIDKILLKGGTPIIEEIDICSESDSNNIERFWISILRTWGFNLSNYSMNKSTTNDFIRKNNNNKVCLYIDDNIIEYLRVISAIGFLNDIDVYNKNQQISLSIKLAYKLIKSTNKEEFIQLTGLKKSF